MRRGLVVLLAGVVVTMGALPAWAVVTVDIKNLAFNPAKVRVAQGEDVAWHNMDGVTHTSTQDGALALWDTHSIGAGTTSSSVAVRAAGTYPYHCSIHTSMHGTVKVPVKVTPLSGTTSTMFTITLASATQSGFTYDIQQKIGTGSWTVWQKGVTTTTVTFTGTPGTYAFRSRLHRTSNDGKSGWSPAKTITIS
jgi:plastocyanin